MIIDLRIQKLPTDKTNCWQTVVEQRGTSYEEAGKSLEGSIKKFVKQPNMRAMRYTLTITKED